MPPPAAAESPRPQPRPTDHGPHVEPADPRPHGHPPVHSGCSWRNRGLQEDLGPLERIQATLGGRAGK